MADNELIIFDFDGTLVSKDTGYEFYKWLIKKSVIRTSLIILILPIFLLFMLNPHTRLIGINIVSFIATFLQQQSLFRLRSDFIDHYFSSVGARAYDDGVKELQRHQMNDKTVVIISGCPKWLLYGVTKHLGIKKVILLGSSCKVCGFSLFMNQHCYHANKIEMAKAIGLLKRKWAIGYSDSTADIPILNNCVRKVLINVPKDKIDQFKSHLSGDVQHRRWT
ncbi:MAG: haloacid dehalogenase-like hydrolase [Pseudomonadales bacterium]|nr:haloacid dehalogenase-like hydrolase [Pseudomonadales bacterium]